MKIFSAEQIKQWDQHTISNKPISSNDLMERAATACFNWLLKNCDPTKTIVFFCGNGNNGGDGLAIARMLQEAKQKVTVYILQADKRSGGCSINLSRLKGLPIVVEEIKTENDFPLIEEDNIVVDALFGTGLNKPLQGIPQKLVQHINAAKGSIISIDMPSGLFADSNSGNTSIIKATHTLSFQTNKLAFMLPANEVYTGNIHLLDIGLSKAFYQHTKSIFTTIDKELIQSIYKPRKQVAHKYSFGHALLYAGSNNMMGAAILSAKACLRSGAGLVTVNTKPPSISVIQTALPEAIASTEENFDTISKKKAAIGIGPGLEINEANAALLKKIISNWDGPLVIDASALQLLHPLVDSLSLHQNNPAILTPHSGEFEKLFGTTANDFERLQLALQKAAAHNCYIVLKGRHTLVACPDGEGYFNTTGNSGMATAGSGDVLTGIITGLLAQGYTAKQACIMGVYLHGLAGDFAAEKFSQEAMIAGDITEQLGEAFKIISRR